MNIQHPRPMTPLRARMIAAVFGCLTPVQGAFLQDVIDVAVILNALRAVRMGDALPVDVASGQEAMSLST